MSNFVDINYRLGEHLQEAKKRYNLNGDDRDWFVICLQGSQNYGLADEESDIDSKLLIIPSLEEMALNKKTISTTMVMPNEEHCDVKDVREYFKIFRKSNINFVEILWTDYWIANPKYMHLWLELRRRREELARYNPKAAVSCMKGMASEKLHALDHEYPSRMEYIKKYGYDPKQLSHLVRIKYFIQNYVAGELYEKCIAVGENEEQREMLLELKRNGLNLTKDSAIELGKDCFDQISKIAKDYVENENLSINQEISDFLDDIVCQIVKLSVSE